MNQSYFSGLCHLCGADIMGVNKKVNVGQNHPWLPFSGSLQFQDRQQVGSNDPNLVGVRNREDGRSRRMVRRLILPLVLFSKPC